MLYNVYFNIFYVKFIFILSKIKWLCYFKDVCIYLNFVKEKKLEDIYLIFYFD